LGVATGEESGEGVDIPGGAARNGVGVNTTGIGAGVGITTGTGTGAGITRGTGAGVELSTGFVAGLSTGIGGGVDIPGGATRNGAGVDSTETGTGVGTMIGLGDGLPGVMLVGEPLLPLLPEGA